jgi:hypothetical protein
MGLLARYRRIWIVIFVALLWIPIVAQIFTPAAQTSSAEARTLRKAPDFPRTRDAWIAFPRSVDNFLADHFGFRAQTTHANALLRYALSSPTHPLVVIGGDHWLFYLGDEALQQSLGLVIRPQLIQPFVDFVASLHKQLSEKNISFLFTIIPNNSTISTAHLPFWARGAQKRTEYDIISELVVARGVPSLDLRPALLAANSAHPVYRRTDTHWNGLGALVSRNEIVAAVGHPEWRIDIARVFRGFHPVSGGDLARFLGVHLDVTEQEPQIDLSDYRQPGTPVVLVIGDSFTQNYFPGIWVNGSRFIWMYHARCKFEMSDVEAHKPDIVIFAPTERYASCVD